jgi:hypothetical protein
MLATNGRLRRGAISFIMIVYSGEVESGSREKMCFAILRVTKLNVRLLPER